MKWLQIMVGEHGWRWLWFSQPATDGEGVRTTIEHSWPWPPWITVVALLAAVAVLVAIYLHEPTEVSRRRKLTMALLRWTVWALVLMMMYGWTRQEHHTDLPDLAVVLDQSASMAVVDAVEDSSLRREQTRWLGDTDPDEPTRFNLARALLRDPRSGWLEQLADQYRVKLFTMGPSLRRHGSDPASWSTALGKLEPTGQASRLGRAAQELLEAQRGRPTAAVLLLTDGITTEGPTLSEAADWARRRNIPFFIVGFGSDQAPRDVRLTDALVEDVVFVDELVPFHVTLQHDGCSDETVVVRLKRSDQSHVLAEQRIELSDQQRSLTVTLAYRPQEEGDFEHVIEVETVRGELNTENNRITRRVRVRDATLRVLLVQAAPSYEYRYLKDLLSRAMRPGDDPAAKAIALTTVLQEADLEHAAQDTTSRETFPLRRDDLFQYDAVIFGDVNPGFLSETAMENLRDFVVDRGGGLIVLAGPRFTPLAYRDTPLETLLPVLLSTAREPSPAELMNQGFSVQLTPLGQLAPHLQLGDDPTEADQVWSRLPRLHWALQTPDVRPAARVLVADPSRPGAEGTGLPIIAMQFVGAGKVVYHATDETFRWARWPGSPTYYARYWLQTLRYLCRSKLASDTGGVEITTGRSQYRRGDAVRVQVRYRDERQAPDDDAGVTIFVEREGGRRRQIVLHRNAAHRGLFEGTLNDLTEGTYRAWPASAEEDVAPCLFTVVAPPGEQAQLAMNGADLRRAASLTGGKFYTFAEAGQLLRDLPRGRRVTIESLPEEPIWNSSWIVMAVIGLLTTEWVMRKRAGLL